MKFRSTYIIHRVSIQQPGKKENRITLSLSLYRSISFYAVKNPKYGHCLPPVWRIINTIQSRIARLCRKYPSNNIAKWQN